MKRKSIGLELMLGLFALAGPEYQNKSILDFNVESFIDGYPNNEERKDMEDIFLNQCQKNKDPRSKTYSEDFVIKCINKGYSKEKILWQIGTFYTTQKQSAEELYEEVQKILKENS